MVGSRLFILRSSSTNVIAHQRSMQKVGYCSKKPLMASLELSYSLGPPYPAHFMTLLPDKVWAHFLFGQLPYIFSFDNVCR